MTLRFVTDWQEMYEQTIAVLTAPAPLFYGRIGGSDTDMTIDYLEGLMAQESDQALLQRVTPHQRIIEEYNGYYNKDQQEFSLLRFCTEMLSSYKALTHASLVGEKWLTLYFKHNIHPSFWTEVGDKVGVYNHLLKLIQRGDKDVFLYPFPFIEKTTSHPWSMFNAFREILRERKVLVVSPFSRTIKHNFHNRHMFFKHYEYPAFELQTYNSPITYKGLPDALYPHRSWFSTADAMKREISQLDFDIALLSCGSYSMPIGDFICHNMKKKAVYVGGVLQLYFGIMGRRYNNPFFLDQINTNVFVNAEEREDYLSHVTVPANGATEGFGAYF